MNENLEMNLNPLVAFLGKPAAEFTREDIVSFIRAKAIRMLNFVYPAGDGRLKTLNFVIDDPDYLETVLACGERVDGSSLFPFVAAGSSDLYVLPRYRTAFVDPFAQLPTVSMLCSFFDKEGNPLESAPERTLAKAAAAFREATGMEFEAMGELEYYVIAPASRYAVSAGEDEPLFPARDQRGYHESGPFAKFNELRTRCMEAIARVGGRIKYGHSEVGNFTQAGLIYEQNEIEFLPVPVCDAADQLTLAKWIIRNMAQQSGFEVTFAPKITVGKAGSGLHIHMRIMQQGRNLMLERGRLSSVARRAIAGMMTLAPSLTAFGNRNPLSYLRLVPHQEAPTSICWGDRNRSVLVRVPLGWTAQRDMARQANPAQPAGQARDASLRQTVEMRSPDGSADVYLLLAGLCVACRHGLEMEDALEVAERCYVDVNIHDEANRSRLEALDSLPDSCAASARRLREQRAVYERYGVFPPEAIDAAAAELEAYGDADLRERLGDEAELAALVRRFFHCG